VSRFKRITAHARLLILFAGVVGLVAGSYLLSLRAIHSAETAQRQQQAAQRRQAARQKAAQQRAGEAIERKLCGVFDGIAALKPPAGDPATNPSRAYEQRLHAKLAEVGPILKCKGDGR
jgi:hypothetical protein